MHSLQMFLRTLAVAGLSVPLVALADPTYSVNVIGTAGSAAHDINKSGELVGYLITSGGDQHAFLYSAGILSDLGTLGGTTSTANGINDYGQVVGGADNSGGMQHAFTYTGGPLMDLGTLGGADSVANGINNYGKIVGSAATAADGTRAFLYSGGTMQNLGTLPSSGEFFSAANAINNSGNIVGISTVGEFTPPEPPFHAFFYSGGVMKDLGTLGGQYSEAFGINEHCDVVGVAATSELHYDNAFLYSHGMLMDLGTLPGGSYAQAFDINNLGEIVGSSNIGGGFLYHDGSMVAIDSLIDPASGWTVVDAHAINDAQQIAGTACKGGSCYAVRLDLLAAVPEPATYGMLLTGLALFGACLRPIRAKRSGLRGLAA